MTRKPQEQIVVRFRKRKRGRWDCTAQGGLDKNLNSILVFLIVFDLIN